MISQQSRNTFLSSDEEWIFNVHGGRRRRLERDDFFFSTKSSEKVDAFFSSSCNSI